MTKKFISDLNDKDKLDSVFLLGKKNLKLTKTDKPYLEMTLSDKSGKIEARLWDNAEKFNTSADTGDVVRIKGTVERFREEKQVKVDLMEKAEEGAFEYGDMVRVAENRDKIYKDVLGYLERVEDPWMKGIVTAFTSDEGLMEAFFGGIGAKSWHNAYIGGLMEHTYEVMCIVDRVCDLYPEADRDVAVFGAFIHDMGKIIELDPKKMEYTAEGGLVGHIGIGHKMLVEKIGNVPGFPAELSMRLEHIILSHHGEYEQQSPVLPKTLEATIVYQTDELVSQANAVKEIIASQAGEGKEWSNFVNIKNRKYFLGDKKREGSPDAGF
jgi:3'-5' exoribonuclease